MLTYFLFAVGFVILVKGADLLVDGSKAIAKRFNISNLIIGLTIVAFGTSLPELFVNIYSGMKGSSDIAIGNILGSNIANVFLILGIAAIIYPLRVQRTTILYEIPFNLLASALLAVLVNDIFFDNKDFNLLGRTDGIVLLCFFIVFMYYIYASSKNSNNEADEDDEGTTYSMWVALLMVIVGIVGLIFGGKWVVDGAVEMAIALGMSEKLVGLTIVAIGTSLPELATSAIAAYKRQTDIAVGNVVGSNIFNIFWILGLGSVIHPIPFTSPEKSNIDICITILSALLLFLFILVRKEKQIGRVRGVIFVLSYVTYLVYLVWRD